MRRVLMVFTVAALVAAMMVSAGPAQAQANEADIENSTNCVLGGVFDCNFDGDDDGDDVALLSFDPSDFGVIEFGDDIGLGNVRSSLFVDCFDSCDADKIGFSGVDFND